MSIINLPSTSPPNASTQTVNQITTAATNLYTNMLINLNSLYKLLYSNPYQLAPQDAFTALGTDAATAQNLYLNLSQALIAILPNAPLPSIPATLSVAVNADGTVSVTPVKGITPVSPAQPAPVVGGVKPASS